jgi:hypothetical protein
VPVIAAGAAALTRRGGPAGFLFFARFSLEAHDYVPCPGRLAPLPDSFAVSDPLALFQICSFQ